MSSTLPMRIDARSVARAVVLVQRTAIREVAWDVILPIDMADRDAETIQAVLNGEIDRYAELVDRYQGNAIRLAFTLLGNHEDAKDASQEAFVSAYRALRRFRQSAKFSTWLYRIVVNACRDMQRRSSRQPMAAVRVGSPDPEADAESLFIDVEDPASPPSDQASQRELGKRLSTAIGRLPMKQRMAFVLHHLQGLPLEEVAGVMRCRLGTVKSHVFRANEHMQRELGPELAKENA